MSDTGMSGTETAEYEEQYAQYRQQSKQEFDQYFNDFERTAQDGSLEDIVQWKDHFDQLAQSYLEAAQSDPNPDKQFLWQAAADNMDYASQTLGSIAEMDMSGFADTVRDAQASMQNVAGERDDEDEETRSNLRDHRQRASETSNQLEQLSGRAGEVKRMSRQEVEQMRSELQDLHQNTQSTSNDHRGADEQAGEHYDAALDHMNDATYWGNSMGAFFESADSVVQAMRDAGDALGQAAAN